MAKDSFKFSGEAAMNYDRYLGPIMFEPYAAELVSRIDAANIASVLEVACGTGRVTRHLRDHFDAAVKLTATDFNVDMLAVAEGKLGAEAITFQLEDAQQLSFPDNSFDLVVCQFGLMFLKDKQQGLREAMRVLRPGGRFIFSTWDKLDNLPLLKLIFKEHVIAYFKHEDPARFQVPFSLHDTAVLKSWMEAAGFSHVETNRVQLVCHSPSVEEIVKGYFTKHSLGAEVYTKDPGAFDEMARKIEEDVIRLFGPTDINFELTAFFVSGEKPL
jgi:ubiquinone/menaquinone biosynthesis C-methylase UbiE